LSSLHINTPESDYSCVSKLTSATYLEFLVRRNIALAMHFPVIDEVTILAVFFVGFLCIIELRPACLCVNPTPRVGHDPVPGPLSAVSPRESAF
jgi:hypothetical protein